MLLQVFIMTQTDKLPDLLAGFTRAGIHGSTVLDGEGALQVIGQSSVEAPPIFASLRQFLNPEHEKGKIVLTVLEDAQSPRAREIVRQVAGDLTKPGTGILFSIRIENVEGLAK